MGYLGNVRPTIALVADDIADGAITTAKIADDAVTGAKVGEALSHRNVIINGAMQVVQRGTPTASITGAGYHTCDRWHTYLSNCGTYTFSQSTTAPSDQGFTNSLKIDCTTADASPASGDQFYLRQMIEAQYLQHLKKGTANAETLVLTFWVRCNKTGNATVELYEHDTPRSFCQTYTISSANTWEQKTLTFAGDTTGVIANDTGRGIDVRWWLDSGSNFTSGTQAASWAAPTNANRNTQNLGLASSTSNEFYVTGVQLEVGTATPYEHKSYAEELARCRRYYRRYGSAIQGDVATSSTIEVGIVFDPPMRATPNSVTLVTATPSLTEVGTGGKTGSSSALTNNGTTDRGSFVNINGFSGLNVGRGMISYTSDILAYDAEL